MKYRVEMWFVADHEGDNADPDRVPDVNCIVEAKDAERAKMAVYHKANRATKDRWTDLEIECANAFSEHWPFMFNGDGRIYY